MRILVLTDLPPSPDGHTVGGQLVYHRLRLLASQHEIAFAYVNWENEPAATTSPRHPYRLIALPVPPRAAKPPASPRTPMARRWHAWQHTLFDPEPYFIYGRRQPELQSAIAALLEEYNPDVVHTVGLLMLYELVPTARPLVAEIVDMWSRAHWQRADEVHKVTHRFQYWAEGKKIERVERQQLARANVALTVSALENAAARRLAPRLALEVMPPTVDLDYFQPSHAQQQDATILYSGAMNYPPNVEAIRYFCRAILPQVQQEIPRACLVIAGRDPAPSVQALASETITVTGAVPDIRPYFARAAVAIVPLLHGGGVRTKIIEAWGMEKAIVSTTLGAEGLRGENGVHYLLADTADEFARHIIALIQDPLRRAQLGKNGRQLAEAHYSLAAARQMDEIYRRVCDAAQ